MPALNQTPPGQCARCGTVLANGTAEGFCFRCLLAGAVAPVPEDEEVASELESPAKLLERREFAGYELFSEIARGGMGVVFRARQKRPDRIVALKVIAAGELATPRMVERFRTEAQAAARLDHPNIVPIYEVGHEGGWHFFSMRLIEGCTLGDQLRRSEQDPREAALLLAKVARAVQHAHERGVLHRDLKPTNILLDVRGEPHLTDFGLAKMLESSVELTMSNVAVGTPAYMSPEQAVGGSRDLTVAVDIYGLGAVFYEMLTGRPPFIAANPHALLRKVAEDDPEPPSHVNRARRRSALIKAAKAVPDKKRGVDQLLASSAATNALFADLDAICLKCLDKEPTHRYHTAEHLAEDLGRALRGESISAKPSTATQRVRKWVRRNPAPAAVLVITVVSLLVITIGSVLFSLRLNRARGVAENKAQENLVQLVRQHGRESSTYIQNGDALTGLHYLVAALELSKTMPEIGSGLRYRVGLIADWSPRPIRVWDAGGNPAAIVFSKDGDRLIANMREESPRIWRIGDGSLILPSSKQTYLLAIPSPDGKQVLELSQDPPFAQLREWETGRTIPLEVDPPVAAGGFTPDGKLVATGGVTARVWRTTDGSPVSPVIPSACVWVGLAPDGRQLLTIQNYRDGFFWDTASGEQIGGKIPARESGRFIQPSFSTDGSMAFVPDLIDAWMMSTDGFSRQLLLGHPGLIFQGAFSPAGTHFATASMRGGAHSWDLRAPSATPAHVAHQNGAVSLAFSPDGQYLASGGLDYLARLCRVTDLRLLAPTLPHTALVSSLAFSPDGRLLASGAAEGTVRVWDATGGGLTFLARGRARVPVQFDPRFSSFAMMMPEGGWQIFRLDRPTIEPVAKIPASTDSLLSWGHEGSAAIADRGMITLYNGVGDQQQEFPAPGRIRAMQFNRAGDLLALSAEGGWVGTLAVRDGSLKRLAGYKEGTCAVLGLSPDGTRLVTGHESVVTIWDVVSGTQLNEDRKPKCQVRWVQFRPDGKEFAVCFEDANIDPAESRIFDTRSGKRIGLPLQHGDGVNTAVYSSDGKLIATVGQDNSARVWWSDDGRPATPTLRHDGNVLAAAFSPDGKFLATGGFDLRFWEATTGELVGPPINLSGLVWGLAFTPDGKKLVACNQNGLIWVIDFRKDERSIEDLAWAAMASTGHRLDQRVGLIPISAADLEKFQRAGRHQNFSQFTNVTRAAEWHLAQAALAELRTNQFARTFHLTRLEELEPKAQTAPARSRAAEAGLGATP